MRLWLRWLPQGQERRFLPGHDAKLLSRELRESDLDEGLDLPELNALYSGLAASEREDLLQELLVAAAQGSEPMLGVIRAWLLDAASREFIDLADD